MDIKTMNALFDYKFVLDDLEIMMMPILSKKHFDKRHKELKKIVKKVFGGN